MATLDKIRLSGTTYDIIDATAIHSLDGYYTTGETNAAITAATNALAESIAEQGYQTSGDVQNAISGKANSADVITEVGIKTLNETGYKVVQLTQKKGGVAQSDKSIVAIDTSTLSATSYDGTYAIKVRTDIFAKKTDIPSVSGYADTVAYDSNTKYMKFYNGGTGGTMVYEFDASPFLIDGMVQNVEIKDVPITEAASTASTTYTFTSGVTTEFVVKVKDNWWTDNNAIVVFTNSNIPNIDIAILPSDGSLIVDGEASGTSSGNTIYVTATGSTAFDTAQMAPDWSYYESVEAVYGSVTCLVISFNTDAGKQDINVPLTAIFDPSNYYTKSEVDSALSGKADSSAVTEEISAAVSGKADTTAVTALDNVIGAHIGNTTVHVTSSDKSTWSGKQDALVSGTNIKTVGGNSLLGSGDIAFPTGLTVEVTGTTLIFS